MVNTGLKVLEPEEQSTTLSVLDQQGDQLKNASWLAKEIKGIIETNDLARALGGKKKHVELEAWTTVCRINNEAPHAKFVRAFEGRDGEEIVEAHAWVTDAKGSIVSEADSFVSTAEKNWSGKPFYARASMAQTRALSKALRLRHSWIMVMAGYEATPAEEMDGVEIKATKATVKAPKKTEPAQEPDAPPPIEEPSDGYEPPRYLPDDPNIIDIIVKNVSHKNGRGILFQPADKEGQPIGEEVWWNTFHKGCFTRLSESIGQHRVVRISKKGDFTNIEEVVG